MKKRERNKNGNGGGGESDQGWIEEYENEAKKDERGTERGKWKRIVGGTNDMWWSNCISFKVHASPIKFEKQVSYQLIMISPSFIHSHFAYDIFSSIFFHICVFLLWSASFYSHEDRQHTSKYKVDVRTIPLYVLRGGRANVPSVLFTFAQSYAKPIWWTWQRNSPQSRRIRLRCKVVRTPELVGSAY